MQSDAVCCALDSQRHLVFFPSQTLYQAGSQRRLEVSSGLFQGAVTPGLTLRG